MRIGPQGKEVLLAVTIKPFLSHKRENARAVEELRDSLKIYGAGGWKDTEDLRVGDRTEEGVRRAMFEETGGMIWWGTRQALASRFIREVEIPCALQRKDAEPLYPLVPVFVDLDPGSESDRGDIRTAFGEHGDDLLECNGLIRRQAESAPEFRRRAAVRYVRDAVKTLALRPVGEQRVCVALRALSEPSGQHHLTFDWRALIDPKRRSMHPGGYDPIVHALETTRNSLQAAFGSPSVLVDPDLPLPLAFLTGYEWRVTTRLRLTVRQRTGVSVTDMDSEGPATVAPQPLRRPLSGNGPAVLAVSCREELRDVAERYASAANARELITLHQAGMLSAPQIRGLARTCGRELRRLNNRGVDKHLLMLGPAALAIFAGSSANASGPVTIPFWNGQAYVGPIVVGEHANSLA